MIEAMIYAFIGFLAGSAFMLLLETRVLRHARRRGYRHAVYDILHRRMYLDGREIWRNVTVYEETSQPKQAP